MIAKYSAILAIVAVAAGLAFWLTLGEEPESLSVARINLPMEALLYVAEAEGFCDDENVRVEFTDFLTGRACLDSVRRGEHDLASVYTSPFMLDACAGADIRAISALHFSNRSTAIVARADSGIRAPADLAGKTIGLAPRTSALAFLPIFLDSNGIDPASVTVVDMPVDEAETYLEEAKVDAVVTWYPYLADIVEKASSLRLLVFHCDVYLEMSVLAGERERLAQKGEAIRRFLRALIRANQFMRDRPDEARRHVAEALGSPTLPPDSPLWADFTPELGVSHVLLRALEQDAEYLQDAGECAASPKLRELIDESYLRAVSPEWVTLPGHRTGPAAIREHGTPPRAAP